MPKRIIVGASILLLCLAAFVAGGIFLNSVQASSNTVQSGTTIKGGFHVLHVQGQDIQATVLGASCSSKRASKVNSPARTISWLIDLFFLT